MAELIADEDVRTANLLQAQARAVELFAIVEQRGIIRPGAREIEASDAIRDLPAEVFGVDRHGHKRIVRGRWSGLAGSKRAGRAELVARDGMGQVVALEDRGD